MYRYRAYSVAVVAAAVLVVPVANRAAPGVEDPIIERFLSRSVQAPVTYRARRHLEAANARFNLSANLDALTEFDADAKEFRYAVIRSSGSDLIRKKVLIAALDAERDFLRDGGDPLSLTRANYRFEDAAPDGLGVERIRLRPLRRDKRLIDGHAFVRPDGDLIEVSGRLAQSPSFWTSWVVFTRRYGLVNGVRVPLSVTSIADVRLGGRSTFSMTYEFESIGGSAVSTSR